MKQGVRSQSLSPLVLVEIRALTTTRVGIWVALGLLMVEHAVRLVLSGGQEVGLSTGAVSGRDYVLTANGNRYNKEFILRAILAPHSRLSARARDILIEKGL